MNWLSFLLGVGVGVVLALGGVIGFVLASPRVLKIIRAYRNRPRYRRARALGKAGLTEEERVERTVDVTIGDWDRRFQEATPPIDLSTPEGMDEARRLEQAQRRAGMF